MQAVNESSDQGSDQGRPVADLFGPYADDRSLGLTSRQDQLFGQILDLYVASGFSRYTLEQVATKLRCSKSTIYALAPSREQLAIAVAVFFFRRAARRIDEKLEHEESPTRRLEIYLHGVADELEPLSKTFIDDMAAFEPTRRIYELNTSIAASRVRDLLSGGVAADEFRPISVAFVAEVVSSAMVAIQTRRMGGATGLTDAEAYGALADLVVHGIRN
jgi:AcrR family transcriptional regulator